MSSDSVEARNEGLAPTEVLTFGRSGVDIYPLQIGVGLEDVQTFGKYLGGTTANVAVAAARLGRRAAIITGVGDDPFGRYVRRALRDLEVDDRHVVTTPNTDPGHLLRNLPPDDFPLWFYRRPSAPDLQVRTTDSTSTPCGRPAMWLSVTGLSGGSRESRFAVLEAQARQRTLFSTWTTGRCSGPTRRRQPSRCARLCRTSPSPSAIAVRGRGR
jgi:5-dehydro-2-deoxygluconokinase